MRSIKIVTIIVLAVFVSLILAVPTYAQSAQPTYTPRPTYTPWPTYTPQGFIPTATPLPTATPYGTPASDVDEVLEDTKYLELFTHFFNGNPILADDYIFGDFHRTDRIVNGIAPYCYAINNAETSGWVGEICIFREASSQIQEFAKHQTEIEIENAPVVGDSSQYFSGSEEDEKYFRSVVVKNDWVFSGHFVGENPDFPLEISRIFNSLFEQLPQDLFAKHAEEEVSIEPLSSSDELRNILDSVIANGLPEGVEAGDFLLDNQAGSYHAIYHLYLKSNHRLIGEMSTWKYAGILLDRYLTTLQTGFTDIPDSHVPFITGGPTFGDRSVEFISHDDSAGEMNIQRFQKFDTYADVRILRNVDDALSLGRQIARSIDEHIQTPQKIPMQANGDVLEQQFLNCFPKPDEFGTSRPLDQFTYSTDMKTEGILYSTRYTDYQNFLLFVNIKEFVLPPTGQDLPRINKTYLAELMQDIYPDDLGERAEAVTTHDLYSIPDGYAYYVYFFKGNTLVWLATSLPEYDDQFLSNLLTVAKKMDHCIPDHPIPVTAISVPVDHDKALLNKDMIFIEDFNKFDNQPDPIQDGLPLLGIPVNIKMIVPQQAQPLPGPLTIAIYNPDRDIYTYKKQEKEMPPYGDYFSIIAGSTIEGRNELHIWSGDQLILVYPFMASTEYGVRQ